MSMSAAGGSASGDGVVAEQFSANALSVLLRWLEHRLFGKWIIHLLLLGLMGPDSSRPVPKSDPAAPRTDA